MDSTGNGLTTLHDGYLQQEGRGDNLIVFFAAVRPESLKKKWGIRAGALDLIT